MHIYSKNGSFAKVRIIPNIWPQNVSIYARANQGELYNNGTVSMH